MPDAPLLDIRDLHVNIHTDAGVVPAVDGVSLQLEPGRTLALVGESGCGKSLTALATLRLLPPGGRVGGGSIRLEGQDLLALSEPAMRSLRGDRLAMIFQEPMTCLNPVLTNGEQIAEPLRLHRRLSRRTAGQRTVDLLRRVGIPAAQRRARDYPHQLSGGMRQRVMIAMAIACEPAVLIADEPTTALDVTIQAQILALLRDLQRETGLAILFITHDLAVVAEFAQRVAVMYSGRIVESADTAALFATPRHPYTRGLLRSLPRLDDPVQQPPTTEETPGKARRPALPLIAGDVPRPEARPAGCAFHPRCDAEGRGPMCAADVPPLQAVAPDHCCACWPEIGRDA